MAIRIRLTLFFVVSVCLCCPFDIVACVLHAPTTRTRVGVLEYWCRVLVDSARVKGRENGVQRALVGQRIEEEKGQWQEVTNR